MRLIPLEYRDNALRQLKEHFYTLLKRDGSRHVLAFQAPTGSGKTVAMACMLRELVNELPVKFDIAQREVAYVWIAPNQLHIQSFKSLSQFYAETRDIRTLALEDLTDDHLKPNEMLFLNWQTVNKDTNIFTRENESGKNFYSIMDRTRLNDTHLVVIIDEEHLMAGVQAEKSEQLLRRMQPKIELRVSATLSARSLQSNWRVIIQREPVVREQMIKKGVHLNPLVRADEQAGDDSDVVLLRKALEKRAELECFYSSMQKRIRPLLLIQLPSDAQTISQDDKRIRDTVVDYLSVKDITEKNGKLAVWLSNEKINLEDISKPDNMVEVLLFKQAIALGWDCPRAAVLLIYREMKSETFTVQTLGRILRMPEQQHYEKEELNYGYVYTNLNKDLITILPEEVDYITENRAERNEEVYTSVSLKSYHVEREINRNRIGVHFREVLFRAAEQLFHVSMSADASESFYSRNKAAMESAGVIMDVAEIEIPIPTDVNIDVTTVGATRAEHVERFAKTTYQLQQLFNRYCYGSCGQYQKDGSWERIKYHTELLFEEYLGMMGPNVYKIALYNQQRFTDLYNLAREKYAAIMAAKAVNTVASVKENDTPWEVPSFRVYPENYREHASSVHALKPLFARERQPGQLFDSGNEYQFIQLLIDNEQHIEWWYKNGSGNRADFGIPYEMIGGRQSMFYVDLVVKFKNGLLGLFDPKTIQSDPENVNKHNALIDYIENRNKSGKRTVGGIILPHQGSWRYCNNRIANDTDLTGWEFFNPEALTR